MAVTYVLMDPVMTVARPATAFFTVAATGLAQNLADDPTRWPVPDAAPPAACEVDASAVLRARTAAPPGTPATTV